MSIVTFDQTVIDVGRSIDRVGVAVIAVSVIFQLGQYIRAWKNNRNPELHGSVRIGVGRGVLLGLEVLVAGDIVRRVGTNPTLVSLAVLASIVGIRSFLSFTIGLEAEGRRPWQAKHQSNRAIER